VAQGDFSNGIAVGVEDDRGAHSGSSERIASSQQGTQPSRRANTSIVTQAQTLPEPLRPRKKHSKKSELLVLFKYGIFAFSMLEKMQKNLKNTEKPPATAPWGPEWMRWRWFLEFSADFQWFFSHFAQY
jgi:hypothetical protein